MNDFTPEIIGKPRPAGKGVETQKAKGKTVEKIEFGEEKTHLTNHTAEAVIFHFTDGSVMSLRVGSNASNLGADHPGFKASMRSTDIMVIWE